MQSLTTHSNFRRSILVLPSLVLIASLGAFSAQEKTRPMIAVIPKGTTHEFWKTVHAGVELLPFILCISAVPAAKNLTACVTTTRQENQLRGPFRIHPTNKIQGIIYRISRRVWISYQSIG